MEYVVSIEMRYSEVLQVFVYKRKEATEKRGRGWERGWDVP